MNGKEVVGWCNKYRVKVARFRVMEKCLPLGCLYYRSYGDYPRRLKVSIGDIIKKAMKEGEQ
jgi:hypothetical protein